MSVVHHLLYFQLDSVSAVPQNKPKPVKEQHPAMINIDMWDQY